MDADVAIIGGGPAGLAAALALVRARKKVVVFDRWPPRNAAADEVHGFVTQDGVPPAQMRKTAREELAAYETFALRDDCEVTRIDRVEGGFQVNDLTARRVILCTGLVDDKPALPGYRELWGTGVVQCPYCHGYEVRDRAFGYLANDERCADWSVLLRSWTKDLIVFTSARFEVRVEVRDELTKAGIRLEERRVVGLRGARGQLAAVQLEDGTEVARDVLFARPPQRQTALVQDLVDRLGLKLDSPDVVATRQYETSIPGMFAAGDLMMTHHAALSAAAAGAAAAHALDEGLTHELVLSGML